MPDDPTTTVTVTTEQQLAVLQARYEQLTAQMKVYQASNNTSKETLLSLSGAIAATKTEMDGLLSKLTANQRATIEARQANSELERAVSRVRQEFGALGGVFGDITEKVGRGLVGALNQYGQIASVLGSSTYSNFIKPLSDGSLTITGLIPKAQQLNDAILNLRTTQTVARIATTLFSQGLEEANRAASEYPQALRRSAAVTGMTTEQLNQMGQAMQVVPGALRLVQGEFAGLAKIQGAAIQPMAVLGTVGKAFGLSAQESATMGVNAWKGFGQTVEETVRQMGVMADAARQTDVDRRTANEQIQQASQYLAIFGRQTGAAAETWTTFMTSLRGAGVPISEIGKIVDSVTQSIAGMSVQNRAFLGMMSGITQGRTALGGGLQLELAMRSPEGMQQNLQALTSTLAQFAGGRIITLEEAARNPQLEMQFQLQRQMLNKLTGITTQEQQNRVLETLQNVQRGGMSTVDGGKALQSAYAEGQSIQEKQLTVLQRIEQNTKAIFAEGADRQLENMDDAFRSLVATGQQRGGLDVAARDIGMAPMGRPIIGTAEAGHATEAIGRQFAGGLTGYKEIQARTGGGNFLGDTINQLKYFKGGLLGEFEKPPQFEPRPVRRPAAEPVPAAVPMILQVPQQRRGATVPEIQIPARQIRPQLPTPQIPRTQHQFLDLEMSRTREPNTRDQARLLSTITATVGRDDGRKIQIMNDLLGSVKRLAGPERQEVPENLLAPTGTPVVAGKPAVAPAIMTERSGTTTTFIVKITDEGGTNKSKELHDSIMESVKKAAIGMRY